MFVLVEMTDTVRIPPWQFERKLNESIAEELNKKLANKVVYNVGLCICLYDITKLEDSYIFPGDGASHTKVHFRYVVFHPFLDEILIGEIKSCSQDGVHESRLPKAERNGLRQNTKAKRMVFLHALGRRKIPVPKGRVTKTSSTSLLEELSKTPSVSSEFPVCTEASSIPL
ncbi:DNA-directed RNA polymerase III subunit RPC8 isoform X4 [Anser cygnoides]|uniref:DNA-directed RNA polymerase III subunit RPC8 isoform X4 n=1 Tax=Anser cygnoides TaxID=8845 RepID=UPI000670782D|nr:DNA-directed RNA polymerase III subunit RPC8 isoform X4 [Anser cygnoides]